MIKTIKIILLVLLSVSSAFAITDHERPVYVRLVKIDCVEDARCASMSAVLEQFTRTQEFFASQLGRGIVLSGVENVSDPIPDRYMTIDEFTTSQWRYYAIKKHLGKLGIKAKTKEREMLLIIDKYLVNNNDGRYYIAGLSGICGLYDKTKYSVLYSSTGGTQDAGLKLALGTEMSHEIAHYFGAWHYQSETNKTFMYPSLWAYDELQVPPAFRTLDDINHCMSDRNFKKRKSCNGRKKCLARARLRSSGSPRPYKEIFMRTE